MDASRHGRALEEDARVARVEFACYAPLGFGGGTKPTPPASPVPEVPPSAPGGEGVVEPPPPP